MRPMRSEGREIDARSGIPITYRTVSFNIANSQERSTFVAQKKKKELADSAFRPLTTHLLLLSGIS